MFSSVAVRKRTSPPWSFVLAGAIVLLMSAPG